MSTRIMSACWSLTMPPTAKSVLISLADNANDEGYCWPSITTIAERTCFSERAVQNAIKWLEDSGLLVANRDNGRHTTYVVTPAGYAPVHDVHPAPDASVPPQEMRQPPQQIPKPPQEVPSNRNKPSRTVNRTVNAIDRPEGVSEKAWDDWMAVRKSKRAVMTQTALDGLVREAKKAGMTLDSVVTLCAEKNWQSFNSGWMMSGFNQSSGAETQKRRKEL